MPNYSWICDNCCNQWDIYMSISLYKTEEKCPKCDSKNINRDYQLDCPIGQIILGDNEVTVGCLADRNSQRFSEDQKEHIYQQTNAYKDKALIKSSYKDEHQGKKEYKKCISKNIKELSQNNLERKLKGKQNAPKKGR